ncbi:hypothetical protein [Paratractidigestivibacter sp.]|uniref:hypothetical protein n=1 Tax=Paratractidigestivibacter sp. TaxID=2847316 RepID=UPI002ABDC59C|nr:hypothetical protein [Paratractidigestivibacter sp.]
MRQKNKTRAAAVALAAGLALSPLVRPPAAFTISESRGQSRHYGNTKQDPLDLSARNREQTAFAVP